MANDFFSNVARVSLQNEHKKEISPNTSKTSRQVEDIDISLIDTDEINEELFGYEDLYKIEQSFDTIGNNSVIYVYKRKNGRYLCYAGNQRLIASKKRGEKKITCIIDGDEPESEKRLEQLIFMNSQRTPRPYYTAMQISEYEKLLRRRGEKDPGAVLEEKFGIQKRAQRKYKQVLTFNKVLQELFKRDDIPFMTLVNVCAKVPEGREQEFYDILTSLCMDNDPTSEIVTLAFSKLSGTSSNPPAPVRKTGQIFKDISSLPYFGTDTITVPEKKKESVLKQATEMKAYLDRIIAACSK